MNIAQVGKDISMHVRTCVPLFSMWGSAGPIALILSMVKNTMFLSILHGLAKTLICTCAREYPFFISVDRLGR